MVVLPVRSGMAVKSWPRTKAAARSPVTRSLEMAAGRRAKGKGFPDPPPDRFGA